MDILIIKIIGMAFPQPFVWRNDISTALFPHNTNFKLQMRIYWLHRTKLDILKNFIWIIKLVVYPRHFKNTFASKSYGKKVTGLSIFAKLFIAAREV